MATNLDLETINQEKLKKSPYLHMNAYMKAKPCINTFSYSCFNILFNGRKSMLKS